MPEVDIFNADDGETALQTDIDGASALEDGTGHDVDILLLVEYIPIVSVLYSDAAPVLGFVAFYET